MSDAQPKSKGKTMFEIIKFIWGSACLAALLVVALVVFYAVLGTAMSLDDYCLGRSGPLAECFESFKGPS